MGRVISKRRGRQRRDALDELLGKTPVAAAHVDPPLARSGRQPIEKDLPHELAPGAHHALVGCSIIEPNGLLGHWRRPPLISPFSVPREIDPKRGGAPRTPRRLGGRVGFGSKLPVPGQAREGPESARLAHWPEPRRRSLDRTDTGRSALVAASSPDAITGAGADVGEIVISRLPRLFP